MAGRRDHHRRAKELVAAVTADAHRDLELTALAAVAEAVLTDLRSAASAIKALVGPVGADLYGANLAGADLARANLAGADLHDAILTRADLHGADLTNADLTNADLRDANLAQVLWSTGTLWPEDRASLMRDRSEELRPGVWYVVGSGQAERVSALLLGECGGAAIRRGRRGRA